MAGPTAKIEQNNKHRPDPTRPGMVRWFAPRELLRNSLEVLIAVAVARFVDPRAMRRMSDRESLEDAEEGASKRNPRRREKFDLARMFASHGEFWFDYVADLGDGFDSTYAIARLVAGETLTLSLPSNEPRIDPDCQVKTDPENPSNDPRQVTTYRGSLLVLGGDLVYPTPGVNNYDERLVAPYNEAARWQPSDDGPHVLALPGNHDWYDGLRGFSQRFCRPGSSFAGWRTCQRKSYFAARLPHDVWLVGADTQLANSINPDQADYFESIAEQIESHHRVILCLATPDWMEPHAANAGSVVDVMKGLLGHEPDVCLAGHRHHYQRHTVIVRDHSGKAAGIKGPTAADVRRRASESGDNVEPTPAEARSAATERSVATNQATPLQRITAGGGGAYLSPTHVPVHRLLRSQLYRHASFPPPSDSLRYRKRLWLLPFVEPWFGAIPAVIYGLGCCLLLGLRADDFSKFAELAKDRAASLPGILFVVVLFLSTLMFRQRLDAVSTLLAVQHTVAHMVGLLLVAYWVLPAQDIFRLLPVILAGGVGWWVGAIIVGGYLWLTSCLDRFVDVGYAALRIDDWKSFLRFHLDKEGNLTIYPIGLRRVPQTWSQRGAADGDSGLQPEDPRATQPELIEMPIKIPARRGKP